MAIEIKVSPENLLDWSHMEDWVDGASAAPTEHTLFGASATVARESSTVKIGTYSAGVTRVGTDCGLRYAHADFADFRGRKVTFGAWVYATVASRARLSIDDGVSSASNSSYHTGGSSWEFLEVTHDMNPCASQMNVEFQVNTGNTTAYFDAGILCEGASTFLVLSTVMNVSKFRPSTRYQGQTFVIPRRPGSVAPEMQVQSKTINLEGMVVGTTAALARTNHDTLNRALNTEITKMNNRREMRDLYLFDDRRLKVFVQDDRFSHRGALILRDVRLRFIAPEPFEIAVNKTRKQQELTGTTTFTLTAPTGSAFSQPIISITNNGSNITSLTVENLTTGEVFSYSGTLVTSQKLVVNTELLTVENNGADDIANFTGDTGMRLLPVDNEFKVTGVVSGTIDIDWFDRWY